MFWTTIICLLLSLLIWDCIHKYYTKIYLSERGLAGCKLSLPLFGDVLPWIGSDITSNSNYLKTFIITTHLIYLVLIVQDAEYLEIILSSSRLITKHFGYRILRNWLSDGLLMSTGLKWHARRKIITPAFHFGMLEKFIEIFDQQSEIFVESLQAKADGQTVIEMFSEVCLTTLNIITETAMGVKIQAHTNPDFPYTKALAGAANILGARGTQPFYFYDTRPFDAMRLRSHINTMHKFTDQIIKDRRESLKQSFKDSSHNTFDTETNQLGIRNRVAFLDLLLQSTIDGKPLSNDDIREEVDTFMFEGHDTTASGIAHTLYLLSRHPSVQEKAYEEVQQVLNKFENGPITTKDLQDLKYLECVIKEALRLYTPVPFIGRVTDEETKIGNAIIPADTQIMISLYNISHDPQYFPNPEAFLPERFVAEAKNKIHPFAFVPFSAGSRNCIGQKYAMLEMKMIIGKVLRNYKLLPLGPDAVPVMSLILRSTTGINVGLNRRPRYTKL
uniref:Cytochrome P450 n=1 Tax=Glossina palpalis gambiensis TaxID=67801 RepID=A0A1B0ALV4_9MUSC